MSRGHSGPLLISLTVAIASFTHFARGYHGPEVVPQNAPADIFSAERGLACLSRILDSELPHPAGSPENSLVRARLISELAELNLDVEETSFKVSGVSMTNVLAVIRGNPDLRPVLLATHYDSVEQGPGAGDAGSCVAALLETARVLQLDQESGSDDVSDVWFLFTDGEEWVRGIGHGLNGARQFAENEPHELVARDPLVLNFDARGATGPSLMYETSGKNFALLKHVLPHLPRPAYTASSYVSVYDLLPNATDFTVFKRSGHTGLNFAFLDDPHRYHTPDDNLQNLDPRSVQHHGQNAVAMARLLRATSDLSFENDEDAVFFTLLNRWGICYASFWAPFLATALLLVQALSVYRRRSLIPSGRSMIACCIAVPVILTVGIVIGAVINNMNSYRPQSWHGFGPHDPTIVGLQWLATFVAAAFTLWLFRKSIHAESMWAVVWLGNAIFGLLASIYLPGFSYIMLSIGIVPAVLGLGLWRVEWMCVPVIAVVGLLQAPLAYQFGVALGPKMAFALGGLFVLFLAPFFPLLSPGKKAVDVRGANATQPA